MVIVAGHLILDPEQRRPCESRRPSAKFSRAGRQATNDVRPDTKPPAVIGFAADGFGDGAVTDCREGRSRAQASRPVTLNPAVDVPGSAQC